MNDLQAYDRWEAQKAELDRRMDDIQAALTSVKTARERRQMERQFESLANKKHKLEQRGAW